MGDGLTPGERSTQRLGVIGWRRDERGTAHEDRRVASVDTACDESDLVPIREKCPRQMPTDKASPAGNCDLHERLAAIRRRCRTCVGQTALRYALRLPISVAGSSR